MNPDPPLSGTREIFAGTLIGTAVGDALGLPAENLSPGKIHKRWHGEWRMRLVLGRGMISDDTEQALMVAQALLAHPGDAVAFQRALAWKFRWWLAGLPGGVGFATAKACLRLWAGFPPNKAGVKSGGAGPAMRSAMIGAFFAHDLGRRRAFASASSCLTHRGWQAEVAALAVAELVALTVREQSQPAATGVFDLLRGLANHPEWLKVLTQMESSWSVSHPVTELALALGLGKGVTGYSLHVVPVAIYAWLRHPDDFRGALIGALNCGGDTDTVGAIVGALSGATVGTRGIPAEWVGGIWEWPRSVSLLARVAARLADQTGSARPLGPVRYFWPGLVLRNLGFLGIVLAHGFRRLAPPY